MSKLVITEKPSVAHTIADWLVGINATRLYSVLYHRKELLCRDR